MVEQYGGKDNFERRMNWKWIIKQYIRKLYVIWIRWEEYNTYIRDFFEDNQGRSLDEAITCWKYKKSLQGHNRYEKSDLVALD